MYVKSLGIMVTVDYIRFIYKKLVYFYMTQIQMKGNNLNIPDIPCRLRWISFNAYNEFMYSVCNEAILMSAPKY